MNFGVKAVGGVDFCFGRYERFREFGLNCNGLFGVRTTGAIGSPQGGYSPSGRFLAKIERMKEGTKAPAAGAVYTAETPPVYWSLQFVREVINLTPSYKASVQFIRSLVVSVIALSVDFGLLVFFKEIVGIHYLVAAAMSFSIGIVVNYSLSVAWVFAHRKVASRRKEFLIFTILSLMGLGLNLVIIAGLVQLHVDYRWAKAVSTVVVFFWNFLARKKILY
jgi:putative flippase GtrA